MSPLSRGRKNRKSRQSDRPVLRPMAAVPEQCDCPDCSSTPFGPESLIDDLASGAADLLTTDDPLDAELFGASLLAAGELAGEGFAEALFEGSIPALARLSTPQSLAALLAIGAVGGGSVAADAARRLAEAGVSTPAWMSTLSQPAKVGVCRHYGDPGGGASMLLCSFDRSGRSHGFIVNVDHTDCGAAVDIILFPGEVLDQVSTMIEADGRRAGVTLVADDLDPAEFRWQVERALDARAVHDREADEPPIEPGEVDGPGYHTLAALLRARMSVLPEPPRPPAPHGSGQPAPAAALEMLAQLAEQGQQIQVGGQPRRNRAPKLPPRRTKADGPAPIYQIKVSLRGAKPPIWRRLELQGDTSLAELHRLIQVAYSWNDSHMHVFETPYGEFGVADRELGHRAEKPVTLEQVAPDAGDKVQYVYDFGDNWEHEILVEKLVDRQAVTYPRCVGGRRAAPPDDCGGIWGYTELIEILNDPEDPEHEERLQWFGLESADDFQPAQFDAAAVTRMLTKRR